MHSAAFRFGLMLAALVAIGAAGLLFAVERQVGRYASEATTGMLRSETSVLVGEYRELGLSGLTAALARHRGNDRDPPYRYLLLGAAGERLAGDLPASAGELSPGAGNVRVLEDHAGVKAYERLATLTTRLNQNLTMVVATDSFDVQDLRGRLDLFTLWSGLAIAAFALVGGYVVGRAFLRRLQEVNRAIDRIVAGERTERLPMIGFGEEFDELARNLNYMLDRIAAAMEALRQVSTDIAHDLRSPLTRLHQHLERIQFDGACHPTAIEDALAQTAGMLSTFEALLRIGTVEGGVGRQRFRMVDLSEILDRVHQAYLPVAEDAGQVLTADHAAGVTILGEAELLAQLFTNLIENAIVHTPQGTRIATRLIVVGDIVTVDVSDTGPGIPASERAKVFGRFHRLDASRSTAGAGLGLSLVAAIAGLHDASHVIPDTEVGLCVRISFPAHRQRAVSPT
ncbi:sensor histidine kinase [Sphingomonas phyllosphaerae]|uniref:sensor histidine kinase n=1 Tax=Sphingomonas phyllosphaerae TaxID=257003 RepID=UPI002412EB84|nr:HAMP domain-containing sensor histidine kinase [Sphingomonas phyllosphaerae]